jgi:hypothetical protein
VPSLSELEAQWKKRSKKRKVLGVILGVFIVGVGVSTVLYFRYDQYPTLTLEQKEQAIKALESISGLEQHAETDYFDPKYHARLGNAYSWAFGAHTDNAMYLERTISEYAVSLGLEEDPDVLAHFQEIYAGYHAITTPKTLYTPFNTLPFPKWYEVVRLVSPHPEAVRSVLNVRNELDSLFARYVTVGRPSNDFLLSYRALKHRLHQAFLVATARMEMHLQDGGRLFFKPNFFEKWSEAVHAFAFATAPDNVVVQHTYDSKLPADAVLIAGGDDRGSYRAAPNLTITLGIKYFTDLVNGRMLSQINSSPSEVYHGFLVLRNEGLWSQIYDLFDPDSQRRMSEEIRRELIGIAPSDDVRSSLAKLDGKRFFEKLGQSGTQYPTDIISEAVDGDFATLRLQVHQNANVAVESLAQLRKVSGEWRLSWPR